MQNFATQIPADSIRELRISEWRERARKAARSTEHEHELVRLEQVVADRRADMRRLMEAAAADHRTLDYAEADQYEHAHVRMKQVQSEIDAVLERIEPNPWKR